MLDSIGTPEIIDLAILGATLLLAAAGFWRGVAKEVFISASLLLSYLITLEWAARWGRWVGDNSGLSTSEGQYATIVATMAAVTVVLGYIGCTIAGLPPADLPGRLGGAILGAANTVFVVSVLIERARQLVLDAGQRRTLVETRAGQWLSANADWVILGMAGAGLAIVIGGGVNRRRRLAIVTAAGPPQSGASGFRVRRASPLAPEAEKIAGAGSPFAAWPDSPSMADTVPLTRVTDPSQHTDRPAPTSEASRPFDPGFPPSRTEVIRCVSCGERITENDRYCPRCGRLLIAD
jgi:hypothetical protein